MTLSTARAVAWTIWALALVALTWPGLLLVNRVEPSILGLPFHLAWFGFWILAIFAGLVLVDRYETRAEDAEGPR